MQLFFDSNRSRIRSTFGAERLGRLTQCVGAPFLQSLRRSLGSFRRSLQVALPGEWSRFERVRFGLCGNTGNICENSFEHLPVAFWLCQTMV